MELSGPSNTSSAISRSYMLLLTNRKVSKVEGPIDTVQPM